MYAPRPDDVLLHIHIAKARAAARSRTRRAHPERRLKVLRVGGKLVVRKGHAAEFIRNLPLD